MRRNSVLLSPRLRYPVGVAKPNYIEFPGGVQIPILYEDRSVLALDKPRGWMLVPSSWQATSRNLQAALNSSIQHGDFWARSRGLKFLRFIHRLDADTTGILLLGKSPGAVRALSALFESREVEKVYVTVVQGTPSAAEWTCRLKLAPDPDRAGRVRVDPAKGKPAETRFRVLERSAQGTLLEAWPLTGRTHQIRVHLARSGHPVVGDVLYGGAKDPTEHLALRAWRLSYRDPFTHRRVRIQAPLDKFLERFGFVRAVQWQARSFATNAGDERIAKGRHSGASVVSPCHPFSRDSSCPGQDS